MTRIADSDKFPISCQYSEVILCVPADMKTQKTGGKITRFLMCFNPSEAFYCLLNQTFALLKSVLLWSSWKHPADVNTAPFCSMGM